MNPTQEEIMQLQEKELRKTQREVTRSSRKMLQFNVWATKLSLDKNDIFTTQFGDDPRCESMTLRYEPRRSATSIKVVLFTFWSN